MQHEFGPQFKDDPKLSNGHSGRTVLADGLSCLFARQLSQLAKRVAAGRPTPAAVYGASALGGRIQARLSTVS